MAQYAGLPEGAEVISTPKYAGLPEGAEVIQSSPQPPAGLPQRDPFSYSPAETESMRQGFVASEGKSVFDTPTVKPGSQQDVMGIASPQGRTNADNAKTWLQSPTPEATSVTDFATRVLPSSAVKMAAGIPTAAISAGKDIVEGAIDNGVSGAAKGVWDAAKGVAGFVGEKTGITPPSSSTDSNSTTDYGTGLPDSVGQWYDREKHQVLTDPVGVALAADMGVKGAGAAVKGAGKVAGVAGDATAGILGTTTGTGANFVKQSIKSGYEGSPDFTKYMRNGGEGGAEIVQSAKDALSQIKEQRGNEYRSQLEDIAANKNTAQLDIAPIQAQWETLKQKFGIKTEDIVDDNGQPTGETKLNLDRSTLGRKESGDVQEISDMLAGWGKQAGDVAPLGLDLLKRKLDNLYTESKDSRVIVSALRDTVKKTIVDAVPEYADMTKGYEQATGLINELDRTLSLGKKPMIDTTMRKLTQAMRDNFQFRKELVDKLTEMTGEDLPSMIAGYNMSSWHPQGGFGKLTSLGAIGGAAAHVLTPAYLAGLVAASPRVVGESLRAIGLVGRAGRVVIDALPKMRERLATEAKAGADKSKGGSVGGTPPDVGVTDIGPDEAGTLKYSKGEGNETTTGKTAAMSDNGNADITIKEFERTAKGRDGLRLPEGTL